MNVTVIVAGDPWAPVAVTVIWPVYVPTAKVPRTDVMVNVPGVVPLAGATISQLESLVAVKLSAPPVPVFVTFTIAGTGSFAMPNTAEKERAV
jgi:hypothetical protein